MAFSFIDGLALLLSTFSSSLRAFLFSYYFFNLIGFVVIVRSSNSCNGISGEEKVQMMRVMSIVLGREQASFYIFMFTLFSS